MIESNSPDTSEKPDGLKRVRAFRLSAISHQRIPELQRRMRELMIETPEGSAISSQLDDPDFVNMVWLDICEHVDRPDLLFEEADSSKSS